MGIGWISCGMRKQGSVTCGVRQAEDWSCVGLGGQRSGNVARVTCVVVGLLLG